MLFPDGQTEGGREPAPEAQMNRECLLCHAQFETAIDSEFFCAACKASFLDLAA